MQWKATLYYKDPADGQINDITTFISDEDVSDFHFYGIDESILDHVIQIEIKQIEKHLPANS